MRIAVFMWLLLCQAAFADGQSQTVTFPSGIDVVERRQLLFDAMPQLLDPNSRIAITKFRQEWERFNFAEIEGLRAEINSICEQLNLFERYVNQKRANLEINATDKKQMDDAIASERLNCQDRYAEESPDTEQSPYFRLYYEILSFYQKEAASSFEALLACNSNDFCRVR